MRSSGPGCLAVALVIQLVPAAARAQTIAQSFEQLQGIVKAGALVVVVDKTGHETWGEIAEVSPSSLVLIEKKHEGDRKLTTSNRRPFGEDSVALILMSDALGTKGAAIYPASWHKLETLPPNTTVAVVLDADERRNYRLTATSGDSLRLLSMAGEQETVEKSRVRKVLRRGFNDPVGNGVALGALAGGGSALGIIAIESRRCGPTCNEPSNIGALTMGFTAFGAGIGALVGWVADKAHKGTEVLFPVPPPNASVSISAIPSRTRKGVSVTVRF